MVGIIGNKLGGYTTQPTQGLAVAGGSIFVMITSQCSTKN